MPPNADTFSHGEHDDESALHSDWGSDEANHECLGDGRPRDDQDELQDEYQPQDDPDHSLLPQSGAQAPDFIRVPLGHRVQHRAARICTYYTS